MILQRREYTAGSARGRRPDESFSLTQQITAGSAGAGAGLESPTTDWAKLYQDLARDLGADRQPPAEAGEPSRCSAIRSTAFSADRCCDQAGSSTLL